MHTWRWGAAVGAVLATLVISSASCGDDDDDDGGGTPPPQVEPDPLNLEIQSVTIPEGPNPRPVVRFRVSDQAGAPVDLATELANWNLGIPTAANRITPNAVPRFTLAQLEDDGDYLSLYANENVAPQDYDDQPGTVPPAAPATQATFQPPSRVAGVNAPFPATDVVPVGAGTGVYDYTMPPTSAATVDRTKTHTAAGWIVRATGALDSDVAYDSHNFVPAGGAAPQLDEVVSDGACNRCHGVLQAHGTRRGTQLCITCHSPQTVDPETSRTVDFKVMIHKIHMGSSLPSVQQEPPTNYFIVGNSQNVHDYSDKAFPWHDGVQHCTVCHTGGEDSDNWRSRPNLAACTSCHDNVKFDGSAGTTPCSPTPTPASQNCNHSGGTITVANTSDPTACLTCHGLNAPNAVDRYHHGDDGGSPAPATPAPPAGVCAPPAAPTVRFAANVHPILSRTGQATSPTTTGCGDCHGATSGLSKYGSATVAESYAAVNAAVNTLAPDDSQLLKKANVTTGTTHAGGDRLTDTETAAIRQWIAECAQNN